MTRRGSFRLIAAGFSLIYFAAMGALVTLAMPVLEGRKPEHDKFPGAHTTATIQPLIKV